MNVNYDESTFVELVLNTLTVTENIQFLNEVVDNVNMVFIIKRTTKMILTITNSLQNRGLKLKIGKYMMRRKPLSTSNNTWSVS